MTISYFHPQFYSGTCSIGHCRSATHLFSPSFDAKPSSGTLLCVHRPLWGLPEASIYYFQTYQNHQCYVAYFQHFIIDRSFLYTSKRFPDYLTNPTEPRVFSCLKNDDTPSVSSSYFIHVWSSTSCKFDCKNRFFLENGRCITFTVLQLPGVPKNTVCPTHLTYPSSNEFTPI